MEPSFTLPGFEIDKLVSSGGSGEVWRACEQATGDVVALKRLLPPATATDAESAAALRRLRREAALLAGLRHPHLVRLRRVVPASDGIVLVLDFAAGGSLAAVLAARGRLPAGEVVTVGAPVAEALAHLHTAGVLHGDVTPANILFDAAGKPLLADFGVARLAAEPPIDAWTPGYADPAGAAGSASDVHGLAAVCYAALAGSPPYGDSVRPRPSLTEVAPATPPRLAAAIESALDPNPRTRPDANTFARALYVACAPAPIRLSPAPISAAELSPPTHVRAPAVLVPVPAQPAEPARPSGRRLRWALGALAAVAGVAVAVLVGVVWGGHNGHASTAAVVGSGSSRAVTSPGPLSASATGDHTDWGRVLAALDAARDRAFEDGDAAALDGVYLPGSPAGSADRQLLGQLVAAGAHARGLHLQLASVHIESRTSNRVVLQVSDTLPNYDVVGPGGSHHEAGRGMRSWIVTLGSAGGRWRIDTVAPAPQPAPTAAGLP